MKHFANRNIGTVFMFSAALLLSAPALHAAITDDDLAKVTQSIQEGKTTRAKAEITILLDDNPNDGNSPKLRKILDSLGSSGATTTGGQSSSSGPSADETLQWIQSHIQYLETTSTLTLPEDSIETNFKITEFELKNGFLTFVLNSHENHRFSDHSNSHRIKVTKVTFALTSVLGTTDIVTRNDLTLLHFTTKPNQLICLRSQYYFSNSGDEELDGKKVAPLENPDRELDLRVKDGKGNQTTASEWNIGVNPDQAERFKEAFDHLIQLNGGGKAESF